MNTINAFSIYLILQADAIEKALTGFVFIFLLLAGVQFAIAMGNYELVTKNVGKEKEEFEKESKHYMKRAKVWGYIALFTMIFNAFTPSSKTLATMVVLPAVANNETIQVEAKEIYDLAKDALKNLASTNQPQPTEK